MKKIEEYAIINGTAYHPDTPEDVINILNKVMRTNTRIRIFYGETKTGET